VSSGRQPPSRSGLYCAIASEHGAQPARRNVGTTIRRYLTYLPLVGFLVTLMIALARGVADWKVTALKVGLVWLDGVNGAQDEVVAAVDARSRAPRDSGQRSA